MKPEEIERWLREKEYLMYHSAEDDTEIYESLARCKALMKKREWIPFNEYADEDFCPECQERRQDGHKPDCAWAAELDGLPRGDFKAIPGAKPRLFISGDTT